MIIKENKRNVIQSRYDMPESEFKLEKEQLPFFMSIMRNQIYSNKPAAVVREYVTNALDEHVTHGVQRMVEVHVPSYNEMTFHVRDFGKGLPDKDIRDTYASYGKSTKRASNDVTGCMGIGCKAAFAYADSFIIRSVSVDPEPVLDKDGNELFPAGTRLLRTYTAVLDESDIGMVKEIVDPTATSEATGITIKVPIDREDIPAFEREIQKIVWSSAAAFKLLNNNDNHIKTTREISHESPKSELGYRCYDNRDDQLSNNSACARMGNIIYPLQPSVLNEHTDDPGVSALLSKAGLEIDFDLGELAIAASREALSYNKETVDAILTRFEAVADHMCKDFIDKMNNTKCLIARAILAHKTKQLLGNGLFTKAINVYDNKDFSWGDWRFWWNTHDLKDEIYLDMIRIRDINVPKYHKEENHSYINNIQGNYKIMLYDSNAGMTKVSIPRRIKTLMVQDCGHENWLDSSLEVYLITYDSSKTNRSYVMSTLKLDQFHTVDVINAEDVEPLANKVSEKTNKTTVHIDLFKFNDTRAWGPTSYWKEARVSIGTVPALYLPMSGYYGIKSDVGNENHNNNVQIDKDNIESMLSFLMEHNDVLPDNVKPIFFDDQKELARPPVYGARKKNWKILFNANEAYNLYDLYRDAVIKVTKPHLKEINKLGLLKSQLVDNIYPSSPDSYGKSSLMLESNYYNKSNTWFKGVADKFHIVMLSQYTHLKKNIKVGDMIRLHLHKVCEPDMMKTFDDFTDLCSIAVERYNDKQDLYEQLATRLSFIGREDLIKNAVKKDNQYSDTHAKDTICWMYNRCPMLLEMLSSSMLHEQWSNRSWPNSTALIANNYKELPKDSLTDNWHKKHAIPAYKRFNNILFNAITNTING
tara:strand:+ start:1394 stop:4009 length:2616 start_codon:yes stop_codon:yes gene_type:complete